MIGDKIKIKEEYYDIARAIIENIYAQNEQKNKMVIAIGGESGSGKSVAAYCIQKLLVDKNISSCILQQDDYFVLAPLSNAENRTFSLANVGMQEVRLDLLQSHINQFLEGAPELKKPLVYYADNKISEEIIDVAAIEVLIVEGTYVLSLTDIDCGVYFARNYKETIEQRKERNREEHSDFIEKILAIEHEIILTTKEKANLVVSSDYTLK